MAARRAWLRCVACGAEEALGPRFDLRSFHTVVLADGALPLGILEAQVNAWVARTAPR